MQRTRLVLYVGDFCPLCDEARDRVCQVMPAGLEFREIVIDGDPVLKSAYGVRIPVLAVIDDKGVLLAEKGWPFSAGQVRRMLAEQGFL
ncbi:MAG: glutaredoxin family protein [Porticoccaceae bacterium]